MWSPSKITGNQRSINCDKTHTSEPFQTWGRHPEFRKDSNGAWCMGNVRQPSWSVWAPGTKGSVGAVRRLTEQTVATIHSHADW